MLGAVGGAGLSGGIGFLNLLGFVPGMKDTPKEHFLYFWKAIDKYMRKRMPIFMLSTIAFVTGTIIMTVQQAYRVPCWWMMGTLFFIVLDAIIAFSTNIPANQFMQSLDAGKAKDSPEYSFFYDKAAKAFTMRGYCAIASFACTIVGCYTQFTQPVNSLY